MQEAALHWSWLQYMISDNWFIEVWRWGVIFLAFFGIGATWVYTRKVVGKTNFHSWFVTVNTLVCVYVMIQEAQQLGARMLVWRLPYETCIMVAIFMTINTARKARDQGRPLC